MTTEEYKAKGKEIWELIKAQPPEVLVWLSDFCGMDDGEPMMKGCPDEAIDDMFDSVGYEEGRTEYSRQTICLGMSLPDIFVDIKIVPDEEGEKGDLKHIWEFSKP